MPYRDTKNFIRQQEKTFGMKPLKMKLIDREMPGQGYNLSFDKQIVYLNEVNQTNKHFFKATSQLNPEIHADMIQRFMQQRFPQARFEVEVAPKFATIANIPIKIPYTNIGIKRDGHKVRGDSEREKMLATVGAKVNIKVSGDTRGINGPELWSALNEAACMHCKNSYTSKNKDIEIIANDVAGRPSRHPSRAIKNQTIPYGLGMANYIIDQPIFHKGISATIANAAIVAAAAAVAYFLGEAAIKGVQSVGNNPSSLLGFFMGANTAPSFTNTLVGSALASSSRPGTFANAYGNGMMFNQTISLFSDAASMATNSPHAPLATRSVIKPK